MIIFLAIYLLIGGVYTAYGFIKAEKKYSIKGDVKDILSDHDLVGVLLAALTILLFLLICIVGVAIWPISIIYDCIIKILINKIR